MRRTDERVHTYTVRKVLSVGSTNREKETEETSIRYSFFAILIVPYRIDFQYCANVEYDTHKIDALDFHISRIFFSIRSLLGFKIFNFPFFFVCTKLLGIPIFRVKVKSKRKWLLQNVRKKKKISFQFERNMIFIKWKYENMNLKNEKKKKRKFIFLLKKNNNDR